jgi:hypothetical protein
MRIISPHVHGLLDYGVGALLILAPALFGFADSAPEPAAVLRGFGIAAILYSIFTRYPFGIIKALPYGVHLKMDFVWGLLLAASPWLLAFDHEGLDVWGMHVAFGVVGMLVPIISVPLRRSLTQEVPQNS